MAPHKITVLLAALVVISMTDGAASAIRHKRQASSVLQNFVNERLPTTPPTTTPINGFVRQVFPQTFTPFRPPRTSRLTLRNLRRAQTTIQKIIALDAGLIPNWVQLSFHECIGPSGCNGCLDVNNPANIGLAPTFRLARFLRWIVARSLTNADFIALLGTEAAKAGAINGNGSLSLPYSIGRRDCPSPIPDVNLPSGNQIDTVELLTSEFGLTNREAVALMGAHSLGRARPENTGFDGPWDRTETSLERGYYFVLSSDNLVAERVDNNRITSTQWKNGDFLMLHADLILRKQFRTSGKFDEPSCGATDVTECPDQPETSRYVNDFRDDLRDFHTTFSSAFLKMITKTKNTLTLVET